MIQSQTLILLLLLQPLLICAQGPPINSTQTAPTPPTNVTPAAPSDLPSGPPPLPPGGPPKGPPPPLPPAAPPAPPPKPPAIPPPPPPPPKFPILLGIKGVAKTVIAGIGKIIAARNIAENIG